MKIIEGDLIMTEDMTLNDDLKVNFFKSRGEVFLI